MVNTASPMGRMLLTVIAAMAELERSLIAERTAQALAHKKKHLEVYSPTPLGFRREGNMLVPDPDEQSLVARMRQMHNEGRSLRGIADQLNAEGIVGKAGGRWYATTVKKVLGNGIHTQERRHSPD
jgi:site-specific DNA recombinase